MNNKIDLFYKILKSVIIVIAILVAIKKQSDGLNFSETFFIYILPILMVYLIVVFFSFVDSQEIKAIGLITFISIILTVLSYETFITYKILDKSSNQKNAAKINKLEYDPKNIVNYLSDLNQTTKAFPFFRINLEYFEDKELMPLGFIPNVLTVGSKESGNFYTYKTDRYGFNNPDTIWDIEGKSILLIGDSFTLGTLPNEKNFADILRKKYKKVINLGIGGNGPLKNYATLTEFIKISNAEYVFWLNFDGNDFEDLNEEINSKILKKYYEDFKFSQNLTLETKKIEELLKLYYEENVEKFNKEQLKSTFSKIVNFYRIIDILKLSNLRKTVGLTRNSSIEKIDYTIFYELIYKADLLSKQNEAKFFFINIPSAYNFSSKENELKSFERFKKIKKNLIKEKISYLDFDNELTNDSFQDFFMYGRNGGHLSEYGNKILGNIIIEDVLNQ